jgi:C-terminal processing protease CtpA/Prc
MLATLRPPKIRIGLGLFLLALLAGCTATSSHHYVSPPMTRELVVADMDFAMAAMAEVHPNLHWRSNPAQLQQMRRDLIASLPMQPTAVDVYVALRRLTAAFNDAHVAVTDVPNGLRGGDGSSLTDQFRGSGGELAVRLDPNSDAATIAAAGRGTSLQPGDVIERVNGQPAASLLARLEDLMPGGQSTKQRGARLQFGRMLWLIGVNAPYQLDVKAAGTAAIRKINVAGNRRFAPDSVFERVGAPIEYSLLPDRIGLIQFYEMTEKPEEFIRQMSGIYVDILSDRPRGLIIDIRDNPGGNSLLGQILLALVTDKAYRPFSERRWKVSQICQDYFRALDREELSRQFADYLNEPPGKLLIEPVDAKTLKLPKLAFKGPVAALIGPDTFSSAEILADAMKTYNLVELFGQPTGEPANQYGEVCQTVLPNSGITLAAPSAYFIRADGNADTGDPVFPHHLVSPGPAQSGVDPVLDAARRWIGAQPAASYF